MAEYDRLSEPQQASLRRCLDARDISVDFVRPYFEKFVRMYSLYKGVLPEEIECTYSKSMLNLAFSAIQTELPRSAASLFSTPDFFSLTADRAELEFSAQSAQKWLRYQVEKKIRLWPRILPTLEGMQIFGTAYRAVGHTVIEKIMRQQVPIGNVMGIPIFGDEDQTVKNSAITSQDIEIFQGLPSPSGGAMNSQDGEDESCLDWFIWYDYMTERKIKQQAEQGIFDKNQVRKLLDGKGPDVSGIDSEFKQKILSAENAFGGTAKPDWLTKIASTKGLEKRHTIQKCFFRDRWIYIGDNNTVLYDEKPSIDWIPIAKYVDTPDLKNHFGIGTIEVVEDVIIAIILNFNHRMDWLQGMFHPTKFISQALIDHVNGDLKRFDPKPYNTIPFPAKIINVQQRIWYDRMPEITPQAFMEETGMKAYIQEITGQSNYSKGMGGVGTLANESATGIMALIDKGDARATLKSLHTEYSGIHDELMLVLKWAKDWVTTDQEIKGSEGGPAGWEMIDAETINDSYGITLNGTRQLTQKAATVQKMMALLPLFLNNPQVPGQKELLRQTMEKSGLFENIGMILGEVGAPQPAMGMEQGQPGTPGMIGGQGALENQGRSVAGRTSVNARGDITPAEFAV